MQDQDKSQQQLLQELAELRGRIALLERAETQSKRMEEALEQERYLLDTLMDHLPHTIYFKDLASRFIRVNRAQANLFSLGDPSEALGKTDFDYFSDEHARQAMADEQEIIRSGEPIVDKEEKETWPDGRHTWVLTTKMPLRDEEGRIVGTFGISRDITEKKEAADALQAAKEAAEAANRAKSAFLANMSHEIRTPLNAVIGMTELVLKSQVTVQQREFLTSVRDSGEALLSVINDILDFSKIEAGRLVLDCEVFDLRESLGDTMKSFALRAHQQGLELACQIHPDVPRMVAGDYNRLRQIIVNLVGNAIKFTEQGEVVLEVRLESLSGQEVELHFTVSDTGIGIPESKRSIIFEMFEQADNSITRRRGGTGLGLAIASRLLDLMAGRIWVESEVGRGSRFHCTVRLGLAEDEAAEAARIEPACLHGMRALVVDDNATNRRILEEILRSWMIVPTCAASAPEAIEVMQRAFAGGQPFELVLTDAHMPQVDGFTLARRISEDPRLGSTVVMMLTSGDRPEDMARCEELGIAAYLLKPIKQSELLEAVELALGITMVGEELPRPAEQGRCRVGPLRVLLAEDSLVNQKLAVALLEGEGHTVAVAQNGKQALDMLSGGPFDLVLMDVQMPDMDGLEATVRIRAAERRAGGHIPIIAMTAHALKGDRERCLAAGMDRYVAKPIRAKDLFAAIESMFPDRPPPPPGTPDGSARPEGTGVEWSDALRAVQGNRDLLRTVIEAALEELPRLVAAIHGAVADRDATKLRLTAHTLKGSLRYFGMTPALEAACHLEQMGQDGKLDAAPDACATLETETERMVRSLSRHLREDGS
jgi:two-component system, sensor histidine kinase and response regulator